MSRREKHPQPRYFDIEAYDADGVPLMVVQYAGRTEVIPLHTDDMSMDAYTPKFPITLKIEV
jgi:hypothetical protein